MHGFKELLQILQARVKGGLAVELVGSRLQTGRDGPQERIRIREIKVLEEGEWGFAMILLEHVDEHATSFPVVNTWLKELAAGKPGDHNSPGPTPAE